ncbi:MAG: enoyl-CoA hydratase/isomerase family protein [Wenzhouxiangellaceae bacterium]
MLNIIEHNEIRELRLQRPPVNALNPELLEAMRTQLNEVHKQPQRYAGLIVSGQPGIFTAGLDLPELLQCSRQQMQGFWVLFHDLWRLLATCPVPVVAAITGHSPAGGTVLSVFCDYRIMAVGDFKIGLNETQVGLVAPHAIYVALQRLLGARAAERHLVAGDLIGPERALQLGLVDQLEAVDQVVPAALAWCQQHAALPRKAMLGNRRIARAALHELFAAGDDGSAFLDVWFDAATQQALQHVVASLGKR